MKRKIICMVLLLVCVMAIATGCSSNQTQNTAVVRIHIRANSNSEEDQNVKYVVREKVIEYVTPLLIDADTVDRAKEILNMHLSEIKRVADIVLKDNNFDYDSSVKLNNEFFPTRSYSGKVFEADYYDALIVNLGTGAGDNWWCVVYPPLCFSECNTSNKVVYISKVWEIISKYFGG